MKDGTYECVCHEVFVSSQLKAAHCKHCETFRLSHPRPVKAVLSAAKAARVASAGRKASDAAAHRQSKRAAMADDDDDEAASTNPEEDEEDAGGTSSSSAAAQEGGSASDDSDAAPPRARGRGATAPSVSAGGAAPTDDAALLPTYACQGCGAVFHVSQLKAAHCKQCPDHRRLHSLPPIGRVPGTPSSNAAEPLVSPAASTSAAPVIAHSPTALTSLSTVSLTHKRQAAPPQAPDSPPRKRQAPAVQPDRKRSPNAAPAPVEVPQTPPTRTVQLGAPTDEMRAVAHDFVNIIDNVEAAMRSCEELRSGDGGLVADVILDRLRSMRTDVLSRASAHGVTRVVARQASRMDAGAFVRTYEVPTPDARSNPPGSVAQVLVPAYSFRGQIIRQGHVVTFSDPDPSLPPVLDEDH